MPRVLVLAVVLFAFRCVAAAEPQLLGEAENILFLGDSITHAGHYVTMIESHLRSVHPDRSFEVINLGLPSETCCGLSEPEHPFPRPNVHERLDRALSKIQPDLVVACYGMNDGIYYPFDKKRFAAYQDGIQRLVAKVKVSEAKLVLMSPPAFDPLPLKKQGKLLPKGADKYAWFKIYEDYDSEVLQPYASWILQQKADVAMTIDLHTPITKYVAAKRATDADFTMSPDGVHVNLEGHRVIADVVLRAWGYDPSREVDPKLTKLIAQRQQITHAAYVSHVGHKRPGVKPGLPIDEAIEESDRIESRIKTLVRNP